LLSHVIEGGDTQIEVERELDTGDNQDRLIEGGVMMMIFAWGENQQTTLAYHEGNRGVYGVEYCRDPIEQPYPTEANLMTQTNLMGDFKVPTRTTTYACIAHKVPVRTGEDDLHVVRVEAILDPRSLVVAHHILVHQCVDSNPASWASLYLDTAGQCVSPIGMPFSGCGTLMYGWAMGMGPLNFPPDAGARMGNSRNAFQYIVIEMHYDNANGIRGIVDSSGYKMYYTDKLRKYDGATLTVGDPYISFPSIPPHSPSFGLEATCPAECTSQFNAPLHVFVSGLHMHISGSQMYTTHYRDNKYLGTVSRSDFFVFDLQHTNYVNMTIQPGDRLNTHCVFNTKDRSRTTGFGYASLSEMCMDFLGYYPRQTFGLGNNDFSYCGYFGYTGSPKTLCGSNQGFMTGASILNVRNPIASDLEETRAIVFGTPGSCKAN